MNDPNSESRWDRAARRIVRRFVRRITTGPPARRGFRPGGSDLALETRAVPAELGGLAIAAADPPYGPQTPVTRRVEILFEVFKNQFAAQRGEIRAAVLAVPALPTNPTPEQIQARNERLATIRSIYVDYTTRRVRELGQSLARALTIGSSEVNRAERKSIPLAAVARRVDAPPPDPNAVAPFRAGTLGASLLGTIPANLELDPTFLHAANQDTAIQAARNQVQLGVKAFRIYALKQNSS